MKTGIACRDYRHSFSFYSLLPDNYPVIPGKPGGGCYIFMGLYQTIYYAKTGNSTNKIYGRKSGTFCNKLAPECLPVKDCRPNLPNGSPTIGGVEKMKNNCFRTTVYNKFTKMNRHQPLAFSCAPFSAENIVLQAIRPKRGMLLF